MTEHVITCYMLCSAYVTGGMELYGTLTEEEGLDE